MVKMITVDKVGKQGKDSRQRFHNCLRNYFHKLLEENMVVKEGKVLKADRQMVLVRTMARLRIPRESLWERH